MDANGTLYGTTAGGGSGNEGVVFQLSPPAVQGGSWTESVLYTFANTSDGANPVSTLVFDKSGNLYGTAWHGGSGGGGTIFQLTPPSSSGGTWGFNVLVSFSGQNNSPGGCSPLTSLSPGASGSFFGVTSACGAHGGGVAYKLTPFSGGQWGKLSLTISALRTAR